LFSLLFSSSFLLRFLNLSLFLVFFFLLTFISILVLF
jgi:hypothetical protein